MCRLGYIAVFTALVATAFGVLPQPAKLEAVVEEDGALILITPVKGAAGYLGVLDGEGPSSVESTQSQLYFGDLQPLTEYTVIVTAVEANGTTGDPQFIVFMTGVGEITGFRVVTRSASIITLEWIPSDGIERYIIDAEEDDSITPIRLVNISDSTPDIPSIPTVTSTGEGSAMLSSLKPMTFYKISIRGVRGTDLGPVTTIKTRTAGSGLVMYNVWTDHMGVMLGGTGSIFKPLDREMGSYTVKLTFPCELERLEVWEATEMKDASNASMGIYVLEQDDLWMQEKSEIGFNFYTIYNDTRDDNCFFELHEIQIEYGAAAVPSEFTEEFDIPIIVTEWGGGGIVHILLSKIFRNPNQAVNESVAAERIVKPRQARMALQLVRGGNCSSVVLMTCWNVDRVYNATVDVVEGAYYFLQPGDKWYTNDIGIMFQWDPSTCADRTDWTAYMLVGGDLVSALNTDYLAQDSFDTCAD